MSNNSRNVRVHCFIVDVKNKDGSGRGHIELVADSEEMNCHHVANLCVHWNREKSLWRAEIIDLFEIFGCDHDYAVKQADKAGELMKGLI